MLFVHSMALRRAKGSRASSSPLGLLFFPEQNGTGERGGVVPQEKTATRATLTRARLGPVSGRGLRLACTVPRAAVPRSVHRLGPREGSVQGVRKGSVTRPWPWVCVPGPCHARIASLLPSSIIVVCIGSRKIRAGHGWG